MSQHAKGEATAPVSTTTFSITKIVLLLPLYALVVFVGLQRWRLQRADISVSHSDFFTYNMVAVEMMSLLESMLTCSSTYTDSLFLDWGSISMYMLSFPGLLYYHSLTCIERYVAVVFPITYMNLRRRNSVRILRISTVAGCLISTGIAIFTVFSIFCSIHNFLISVLFVTLTLVSFCSVSVLYVLKRPGPGAGDRAVQCKRRAFYTIMAIFGTIGMWMMGTLINFSMILFGGELYDNNSCVIFASTLICSLPSSLVLPLLFWFMEAQGVFLRHCHRERTRELLLLSYHTEEDKKLVSC